MLRACCLDIIFFDLYELLDIETHHLGHLTKLKQSKTMEYFIASFEQLIF
jgi:hypothetical protein